MSFRTLWLFPLVLLASCGGEETGNPRHMQSASAHVQMAGQGQALAAITPVVLPYKRGAYLIAGSASGTTVRLAGDPGDAGVAVPANAIIRFSDTSLLPYVEDGSMGRAYRLYRAAFARTPDLPGLLYWIGILNGGSGIEEIANGFVDSMEFRSQYGDNAADPAIISRLYRNVLGREADAGGLAFWQAAQARGVPLAAILKEFSESAENKASTAVEIAGGIAFMEDGIAYPGTAAPTPDMPLVVSGQKFVGGTLVLRADPATVVGAQATYAWSVMSKPANSRLDLASSAAQLRFVPDAPGVYHIGLLVNDGGRKLNGALQVTVTEQRLLNRPYLARNGMTVTLEKMTVTDRGNGYVDYAITYVQANKGNLALDEGMLKLYFETATAIPQYGFFNKIYPGETLRRSHTFTELKTAAPSVLEYDQDNFFRPAPAPGSLQWPVPLD